VKIIFRGFSAKAEGGILPWIFDDFSAELHADLDLQRNIILEEIQTIRFGIENAVVTENLMDNSAMIADNSEIQENPRQIPSRMFSLSENIISTEVNGRNPPSALAEKPRNIIFTEFPALVEQKQYKILHANEARQGYRYSATGVTRHNDGDQRGKKENCVVAGNVEEISEKSKRRSL